MKVACKNVNCKNYYELSKGEHCAGEETCPAYMSNKKKASKQIMKCKDCEYCKRVMDVIGRSYHWECQTPGKEQRIILFIENRVCDCKR